MRVVSALARGVVTPPKLGVGKVPIPSLTDSQRLRSQVDPTRTTQRSALPSTHESHDGPRDDIELVLATVQLLESRITSQDAHITSQDERISALEARREPSSPPGTVTLKSPSGWLAKAPPWLVLVGMLWGAAYAASKVPRDVWAALRRLLKLE